MASNFGIAIDKTHGGPGLKLAGDFDATSAYELIYAIKTLPGDPGQVHICTRGLKTIHPFGLDVFHRFMNSSSSRSTRMVFTGKAASLLSTRNGGPFRMAP